MRGHLRERHRAAQGPEVHGLGVDGSRPSMRSRSAHGTKWAEDLRGSGWEDALAQRRRAKAPSAVGEERRCSRETRTFVHSVGAYWHPGAGRGQDPEPRPSLPRPAVPRRSSCTT
jgi:hypothetical protein